MKLLSESELNIFRGKCLAGKITAKEALSILDHLALLETELDKLDEDDVFGTEGWRHFFNVPD